MSFRAIALAATAALALAAAPTQIHLSYTGVRGELAVDFVATSSDGYAAFSTSAAGPFTSVTSTSFNFSTIGFMHQVCVMSFNLLNSESLTVLALQPEPLPVGNPCLLAVETFSFARLLDSGLSLFLSNAGDDGVGRKYPGTSFFLQGRECRRRIFNLPHLSRASTRRARNIRHFRRLWPAQ